MVRTVSTMLELGTAAPNFSLLEPATGEQKSLSDFDSAKALLVIFTCNHCPYVLRIEDGLIQMGNEFKGNNDVAIVAIGSNDADNYPDDSPEKIAERVKDKGYQFPYLFDADQEVAKAYAAACTPDFFLFDADRKLVYRGQFDDARPRNEAEVSGKDMKEAINRVLADEAQVDTQIPSMGCNIKWKPDNAPEYFTGVRAEG
ncbi:MAG: thioredoxin family protein [Gammaproteobacteria bacterium]|nr:thioredoxin family protein [Gammaproteobacteria bacterium]